MKKALSLLLVLMLVVSLCACGGSAEPTQVGTQSNDQNTEPAPTVADTKNEIQLGQDIVLDFATMNFSSAAITYSVGGSGFSHTAQDGMRNFSLVGTIENTGGNPLPVGNIKAEMVFNNEYTYNADATILNSRSFPVSVAPLVKAEYWIYAEIPEALLDKLSVCEVRFFLNEDFASVPEKAESGDYTYRILLDENACSSTLDALNTVSEFFAECPILPTPANYGPLYQSNSSTSSRNGKVTAIKYGFSVSPGRNDDVNTVYNTYIENLQNLGFTIKSASDSSCEVYAERNKLASISVNSGRIQLDIVPGNEDLAAPAVENTVDEEDLSAGDTLVKIGDTIKTEYISMTLDKYESNKEIRSGTSNYGTYTYYTSDNGDPYFYICGVLKNLGGKPVDIRNVYVQFCFDGKYNYKGTAEGVAADSSRFINDVSPLSSVNYYMYAAVPQELIDSFTTCTVRIGFTENFDYKVVDVNDLPQFENCDDIFCLEIEA